jgi:hypothetical protein
VALGGAAMRLSLGYICAVILFALTGCDVFPFDHVLEIHCDQDTEFDNNKLCLKPNRPGAELAFRVNERTQKVLITIVKNDGSYFGGKDLFLEHCSIVDDLNWKCRETNGLPESAPFYHQNDYAMIRGRYYHSLVVALLISTRRALRGWRFWGCTTALSTCGMR